MSFILILINKSEESSWRQAYVKSAFYKWSLSLEISAWSKIISLLIRRFFTASCFENSSSFFDKLVRRGVCNIVITRAWIGFYGPLETGLGRLEHG